MRLSELRPLRARRVTLAPPLAPEPAVSVAPAVADQHLEPTTGAPA
jgi:hypothetical protein